MTNKSQMATFERQGRENTNVDTITNDKTLFFLHKPSLLEVEIFGFGQFYLLQFCRIQPADI